jgi:hypothetical protein
MAGGARTRRLLRSRAGGIPGVGGPPARGLPAQGLSARGFPAQGLSARGFPAQGLPARTLLGSVLLLVTVVVSGAVWSGPPGRAVVGWQATSNPGVVAIYEQGQQRGSGMLVDRNWVLTTGHIFVADLSQYTFRFGGTDDGQDGNNQANLRTPDRMAVHPTVPDLVMVHFADPVPDGTDIMPVATTNPFEHDPRAVLWGWGGPQPGTGSAQLRVAMIAVADQDPVASVARLRVQAPDLWSMTGDAAMLALNRCVSRGGDSGGALTRNGSAVGMHWGHGPYRVPTATGMLTGPTFHVSYEIALWPHAQWIRSVINGEGTSNPDPPPHDELKRRKLEEGEDTPGQAVMTGPTPCPGDGFCDPQPATPLATLVGYSTQQGAAPARCAGSDDGDTCSYDTISHPKDSTATLQLAPPPTTGIDATTGRRNIIVWCKHTGSLTTGAPPTDLVRFSFTNTDITEPTPAYGWWDTTPHQLEDLPDNPSSGIDLDQLSTCPD